MHALLVSVKIDPAHSDAALERLRSQIVPTVKQTPGLVAGYWLAPASIGGDLVGYSTVVFDSEENARKAHEMAKSSDPGAGVQFTHFEIREVVAHT